MTKATQPAPEPPPGDPGQSASGARSDRRAETVVRRLKGLSTALVPVYLGFAAYRWLSSAEPAELTVMLSDLGMAFLALVLRLTLATGLVGRKASNPTAAAFTLVVFGHTCLIYLLIKSPEPQGYVLLLLAGLGFFILSTRWLSFTLAVILATWIPVLWRDSQGSSLHVLMPPAIAAALSLAVCWMRVSQQARRAEQMEAEALVRASEQRYRSVFETSVDGLIVRSLADGKSLAANPAAAQIFGYSPEEFLGLDVDRHIHPEDVGLSAEMLDTLRKGDPFPFMGRGRHRDGSVVEVEGQYVPFPADGEQSALGILRDVSERNRALNRLAASETEYRSLVEDQTEFVVRWLPDGTRTFVNEAYCRYFETPGEDLIGTSFMPLVHEEARQRIHAKIASLTPDQPAATEIHLVHCPDGSLRWQEWTDRGLFDEEGHLVELHSVGRDIHERHMAQLALRAVVEGTSKAVGSQFFRSVVEHLAVALGVRYVLIGKLGGPERQQVESLAVWQGGEVGDNFVYDLRHTPCENVVAHSTCSFPEAAQERFPRDALLRDMGVESYLGTPLKSSSANPLGLLAVMDDKPMPPDLVDRAGPLLEIFAGRITAELERMDVEATLKESEEQYRRLVEELNEVIYAIDADGVLTYVSPPVETMLGFTSAELVGRGYLELAPQEDQARMRDYFRRALSGDTNPAEYRILNKAGEILWVRSSTRPIDDRGRIVGLRGTLIDVTERRLSKEALEASEERFRALFEGSPDAIFVEDLEGRMLDANPAGCRLCGLPLADLIGLSESEVIPVEARAEGHKEFERIRAGEVRQLEGHSLTADGRRVPVNLAFSGFEFLGRPALLFQIRDISRLHRAESALRDSQLRLQRFFDAAEDAVLFHREGKILDANERLADLLGAPLSEIMGRQITDFVVPRERLRASKLIERGDEGTLELSALTQDATEVPLEVISRALDSSGDSTGVVSLRDITDRKRRLEALRDSEERYRSLFEASYDAIYISSVDGTIESVNTAFMKLFGFTSKRELLRTNARQLYRYPAEREKMQAIVEKHGFLKDHEVTLARRDGTEMTVVLTASVARDENGEITLYRGIMRDVTRQRALEQQLRQTQKMEAIGRLAGGVAHDFNNLLTAINGYAQLGMSEIGPENCVHGHLVEIQQAGLRAAELTRQLLALSRQQVLKPRVLDLSTLAGGFENLLRRTIGDGIELGTVLEPKAWHVKADPGQIEQVLMNLVVNARDAMPGGGRVTIETRNVKLTGEEIGQNVAVEPGPYVMLAVADTGCGMDADTQSRIFEAFFTTKEEGQGTGLGMATVYGIVKQSGGYISVYSEPGAGTIVKVYLPRVYESLEAAPVEAELEPSQTEAKTILVAEDNPIVRGLVAQVLRDLGHEVLVAKDPAQALEVIADRDGPLDLLLTDLVMPQMSGLELAEKIAAERPDMGVLVMSGYSKETEFNPDPLASKAAFLQKPFTPDALRRSVMKALDAQVAPAG